MKTLKQGIVTKVSGPLVIAKGMEEANMFDVVKVSDKNLIGEIIGMNDEYASIQVYEETSGVGPGEKIIQTGMPLSVELGPGMLTSIYDGIQSNLDTTLQDIFSISDAKQEQWNQTLDTYKEKGIKQINDIYDPMQNALKNDIASRFGNLDNSIFMDNLSNITENKAQAVADLSDSLIMKQNDLYSTEMANRMNYISLLSGLYSNFNSQMLNYMQLANANTASGNNYNQLAYQANQQNSVWNRTMQGLNTAANVARAVSSFTPKGAATNIAGN